MRLHLLPLAVAAIVLATMVPIELRPAVWWDGGFDDVDFIQNLLLYAPLGVALYRWRRWTLFAAAVALAVLAEAVQMWSFERFSSPYDVVSNAFGALLGAWCWQHYGWSRGARVDIGVSRGWVAVAAASAATVLVIWNLPARSASISGWDPGYEVLLGNESTNDRPWKGELASLTVLRGALSTAQVHALAANPANGVAGGKDALYRSPAPLTLTGPAVRLPHDIATRFVREIESLGAFTVIVRIIPADALQDGPARIVTFSAGTMRRNFDLGQEADRIAFRVRSAVSGPNAEDFRSDTVPVLKPRVAALIVATYDGAVSRIYVDGSLYGRSNVAAYGCRIYSMCDSAVPIAWSVLGAACAVIVLAFMRWRGRAASVVAAMLAAGAVIAMLRASHLVPAQMFMQSWMQYMAFVGALMICVACVAPPQGASSEIAARS